MPATGFLRDKRLTFSYADPLPNATSKVSMPDGETAALKYIDINPAIIRVFANTAITIAESATLKIEPVFYSANTPASAAQAFTYGSLSHLITGGTGGTTIAAGTEICAFMVGPEFLKGKEYGGLKYTASGDLSDYKVTAFAAPY